MRLPPQCTTAPARGQDDTGLPVSLLLLPGASMMTFASTLEPMRAANRVAGRQLFDWCLLSGDGQPVATTCGVPVQVQGALPAQPQPGLLLLVAGFDARRAGGRELVRRIARAASGAELVVGIEAGPWLMARAGLLDGRRATTHWEDLEDFASRHPRVQVCPDRYVIDGRVATTGGASPTFDFMLNLVRQRFGADVALAVASVFSYDEAHAGGDRQSQVAPGRLERAHPIVAAALRRMGERLDAPLPVAGIAAELGVSPRTLEKRFRAALAVSPGRYYLNLRLGAARRLVVDTALPLTEVALRAGFGSASAFSRAFRRRFGVSAARLRRRAVQPERGGPGALAGRAQP